MRKILLRPARDNPIFQYNAHKYRERFWNEEKNPIYLWNKVMHKIGFDEKSIYLTDGFIDAIDAGLIKLSTNFDENDLPLYFTGNIDGIIEPVIDIRNYIRPDVIFAYCVLVGDNLNNKLISDYIK